MRFYIDSQEVTKVEEALIFQSICLSSFLVFPVTWPTKRGCLLCSHWLICLEEMDEKEVGQGHPDFLFSSVFLVNLLNKASSFHFDVVISNICWNSPIIIYMRAMLKTVIGGFKSMVVEVSFLIDVCLTHLSTFYPIKADFSHLFTLHFSLWCS